MFYLFYMFYILGRERDPPKVQKYQKQIEGQEMSADFGKKQEKRKTIKNMSGAF